MWLRAQGLISCWSFMGIKRVGSGCPVSSCLFGCFLLLVRFFLLLVRFHNCTCAIYILLFIYIFPFFILFACVCRRWKLSFIPVYNILFLPAPGSLGFLCPLYLFLCLLYFGPRDLPHCMYWFYDNYVPLCYYINHVCSLCPFCPQ